MEKSILYAKIAVSQKKNCVCVVKSGYKGYNDRVVLERGIKRGMTIEYLKCRAYLNFELDFTVNGAIGTIVTKWDRILFR